MMFPERGQMQKLTTSQETFCPKDLQPAEADGIRYSRHDVAAKAQSAEVHKISKHPVICILLRIDASQHQDEVGHRVKQQGEWTRADLEACLAAIHKGAG